MNERLDFKGRRAVVVNDDPTQLAIFTGLLKKEGLNVQFFMSAEEAIRQMSAKSPPHLIVSDIYMPGIDGWRFCRLLRSPEYLPFNRTPILVTSATFTGQDISTMTTRLGADAFLASPVDGPKFLEVVRKLLSGEKLSFSPAVLIIEEDRDLADRIARAFEGKGYRPIIALTGREGRRIFREESPGFIILDDGLADMKVEFLLREIRDLSPDTVVIVTASEPGPERALESLKRGAQDYGAKSLDPEDLIHRCENAGREKALIRTEDFLEEKARALKASEEQYRLLFEEMLDGFALLEIIRDTDGKPCDYRLLNVNPGFERHMGLQAKDVLGKPFLEIIPEVDRFWIETFGRVALVGEAVEFERFSKFLGKWLEVRLFRPEEEKLAFMFQDITGRKRTEKALLESEKEAKRLAQEAEVLATIGRLVGSTLKIEAVYPSFAEEAKKLISFDRLSVNLNRYQENAIYVAYASGLEIEGRRVGDLFPLPGSSNEKVAKKGVGVIISAQEDGSPAEDFPSLNLIWAVGLLSNLSVPLITGDRVIGALHFRCKAPGVYSGRHLDLAQRIANQIAGAIANAQLFAERNELEKQLIQAQKMEAIGTLAGGIAHDFNNILAAIIGYSQLVGLSLENDPKTEKNLQEVIHAANRARDLVKQILTFSRRTDQERRPLQMELVVKEGLKLLRASLPATVEIQQEMASNGGTVMANPTQINQVLLNLCTNAAQAMGEDGGRLGVRLNLVEVDENMTFQVPDLQMGSYLCLEVSDTGQGIRPEILGKIFEPYFTTKPVGVGTGLGLAVVHGIVKGHGGAIAVKSEVGKGTTFRVFFPRLPAAGRVEVGSIPEAWRKGKGERILFVDDEQPLVEIARQTLEHLGYGVEARTSGVEALELFRAHPEGFDLVITDLTMPNLTGDKLALAMLQIRPKIPIVLCTGFSEQITEERARRMGIRELLLKPCVIQDLAQAIHRVLGNGGTKRPIR